MSPYLRISACLVMSSLVTVSVNAQHYRSPDCWQSSEVGAARVVEFQTMLMVGALNCARYNSSSVEGYNAFLDKKRQTILSNLYVIRGKFVREKGFQAGNAAFTQYETMVGNRYSAAVHDTERCRRIGALSRLAASASDADFESLVIEAADGPVHSACGRNPRDEWRALFSRRPAPAPAPAIAALAPMDDRVRPLSPETPSRLESASADFSDVDTESDFIPTPPEKPVTVVSLAPNAPAPVAKAPPAKAVAAKPAETKPKAPADASAALAEAAKALAAAAAALQAQTQVQ